MQRMMTWMSIRFNAPRRAGLFMVLLAALGLNPTAGGAALLMSENVGQITFNVYFIGLFTSGFMLLSFPWRLGVQLGLFAFAIPYVVFVALFTIERNLSPMGAVTYVFLSLVLVTNIIQVSLERLPVSIMMPPIHVGVDLDNEQTRKLEVYYRKLLNNVVSNAGYSFVVGEGGAYWQPDTDEQAERKSRNTQGIRVRQDERTS